MFIGNFISNLIGVTIVGIVIQQSIAKPPAEIVAIANRLDLFFMPISFSFVGGLIVFYEWPIRNYLNRIHSGQRIRSSEEETARRRLLNEPFVLIGFNIMIWLIAAIVYSTAFYLADVGTKMIGRMFFQTMLVGLVTSIVAFFVLERTLQKKLVPHVFPGGGLYTIPKTLRIRIFNRIIALVLACNIVPCIAFIGTVTGTYYGSLDTVQLLERFRISVVTISFIFIGVGLFLAYLVSSNLSRPFGEIIEVLRGVKRGRLDRKVRVTSNDEIGYTGDVINEMTEGLKEREKMRRSLDLAREVQQNLLPRHPPQINGLDIAGKSLYCDQTGGDYFDYLTPDPTGRDGVSIILGDVSGHGIPSALLMATARAFLRLRAFLPGGIEQVVTDVNRRLAEDVEETGQFMTLFYLRVDTGKRRLEWVRAGHDPGIFYDPTTGRFSELGGPGIALGIDDRQCYESSRREGLEKGQIIVLCTDGIWEACNAEGEMYGKQRVRSLVRNCGSESAGKILDALIADVVEFQEGSEVADDITLVVVKVDDLS